MGETLLDHLLSISLPQKKEVIFSLRVKLLDFGRTIARKTYKGLPHLREKSIQ